MLLATQHRTAIIVGYAITAIVRVLVTWTVVTVVALLAGMEIGGSAVDVLGLYVALADAQRRRACSSPPGSRCACAPSRPAR